MAVGLLALVPFWVCHKLSELSSANEILDLLLQLKTVFGIVIVVFVIPTVLSAVSFAKI